MFRRFRHRLEDVSVSVRLDDETQVNTPMPNKASGPKKARWTTAQKSEARKAPKKAHHRGQPDGPKSAPKRAARSDSGEGYTKRPRAERSPRWDREDPRRQAGSGRPPAATTAAPAPTSSLATAATARPATTAARATPPVPPTGATPRTANDRNDRPKRWVSDSREERHVHRPHDERPRLERGERPVRDRAPRVADPVRRDRHEGRRVDRTPTAAATRAATTAAPSVATRAATTVAPRRLPAVATTVAATSGGYQGAAARRPWRRPWRLPGP